MNMDYFDEEDIDLDFNTGKPDPDDICEPRRHSASAHGHIPEPELKDATARLKASDDQWLTALEYAAQHMPPCHDAHLEATIQHDIAVSLMARVAMQTGKHLKVYHGWEAMDETTVVTIADQGWVTQSAVSIDGHDVGLAMAPSTNFEKPPSGGRDPISVISYSKVWKAEINWDYTIPESWLKAAVGE